MVLVQPLGQSLHFNVQLLAPSSEEPQEFLDRGHLVDRQLFGRVSGALIDGTGLEELVHEPNALF